MKIPNPVIGLIIVLGGMALLAVSHLKQDTYQDMKYVNANGIIIEDEE